MSTTLMTKEDVKRSWYVFDLKGENLGRSAVKIAQVLLGKHRPDYTPHIDTGDFVIVVNAGEFTVTGDKMSQKLYKWHTGYPGGLRVRSLREQMVKDPRKVIERAVYGMLPKNRLLSRRMNRLKVYLGDAHPHAAQRPKEFPKA